MAISTNFGGGMRFYPSDEEILSAYLLNKHQGKPLPHQHIILERDVYAAEPWEIFRQCSAGKNRNNDDDRVKYFFTTLKRKGKKRDGARFERRVGNNGGTWHGSGKPKPILIDKQLKGYVTTFSYKNNNNEGGQVQGSWTMKEYVLDEMLLRTVKRDSSVNKDCVVCRIKRKKGKDEEEYPTTSTPISAPNKEEVYDSLVIELLIEAATDSQDDHQDPSDNIAVEAAEDCLFTIRELIGHDKFVENPLPESPYYAPNIDIDWLHEGAANSSAVQGDETEEDTVMDGCYDDHIAAASHRLLSDCDRTDKVADAPCNLFVPPSGSNQDDKDIWWREFDEMADQLPDPPDDFTSPLLCESGGSFCCWVADF